MGDLITFIGFVVIYLTACASDTAGIEISRLVLGVIVGIVLMIVGTGIRIYKED